MTSKSNEAVSLSTSEEDNSTSISELVEDYKKLGEKCDEVMVKIRARKEKKAHKKTSK
jgi:hypothetical protein